MDGLARMVDGPGETSRCVLPAIYDNEAGISFLCRLAVKDWGDADRVVLDLRPCTFLGQSAIAALGAIVKRLHAEGRSVGLHRGNEQHPVYLHLRRNGFLSAFGLPALPETGHAVGYRHDPGLDKGGLMGYLIDRWLRADRGDWVRLSATLRHAIAGTVAEIYINSFEHSGSQLGVFSSGQHYPRTATLSLSVVDLGVGIAGSVRRFRDNPAIRADRALQWAFAEGTSTKRPGGMGRGLGLGILREFVQLNGGRLKVVSNDGEAEFGARGERYRCRAPGFPGTMASIEVRCDGRRYRFSSDAQGSEQ